MSRANAFSIGLKSGLKGGRNSRLAPARSISSRTAAMDKEEALRFEIQLAVEPLLAPLQEVGTVLLARVAGLFVRMIR